MGSVQTFTGKGLSHTRVYNVTVFIATSPPIQGAIHGNEQNGDNADSANTTNDTTDYCANKFG